MQPLTYLLRGKLGTIVRSDMLRYSPQEKQLIQNFKDIPGCNMPGHPHRQAFSSIFVNDHQYPKGFAISSPCHNEIIAPDVVLVLGAKSYTGTVIEP
jgi:hypothetical protein